MKQYRIVTLGDWHGYYSYFLYGTMEGAIRNGAWHRPVYLFQNKLENVLAQMLWFKPHLIFCHMIFNRRPHDPEKVLDMLKLLKYKTGCKVAYHMGDARTQPRYIGDISRGVDFVLMNHGMLKEFSKTWNVPTYHWPYFCFYQKEIMYKEEEFRKPVIFTGALNTGGVHRFRSLFIKDLKKRIDVEIYPNASVGNTRFMTAEVSSSADCVLGVQMEEDIPLYLDVRPFQYPGAGALFFHDESEAMKQFFKPNFHYVRYRRGDINDFVKKYEYYVKKNPEKGDKIRKQGFEFCQAYHSTKERVRYAMDIAEGKKVTNRIYLKDLPV